MGIIDKIKEKIAEQNKLASKMADNLFTHSRNGNPVIRPMTREDVLGLVKNGVYLRGGANLMAKTYRDTVARHREKGNQGAVLAGFTNAVGIGSVYTLNAMLGMVLDYGNIVRRSEAVAKEAMSFDETGKPTFRKLSKNTGRELLLHPLTRVRAGALLLDNAGRVMKHRLNLRIPEDASRLKATGMAMVNDAKASAQASKVYAEYIADSSLLGYVYKRMKERYGEKEHNVGVAKLKAKTDGKDYM